MFETELRTFAEKLPELLQHSKGQFVVIKDMTILGAFTTEEEAYSAGINAFGNTAFLIKQVTDVQEVVSIPAFTLGLLYAH